MPQSIFFYCAEHVLDSKIDEEIVIMSPSDGFYYGLDEIASRIWELLKEKPLSVKAICDTLKEEYEVDEATCQQETLALLQNLKVQGLIKEVEVIEE